MFRRKKPSPPPAKRVEKPVDFPTGLAIRTPTGVYFIKGRSRFRFASERVFASWNMATVEAVIGAFSHYTPAGTLGFRDGTLIKNIVDGKMYLIAGNKKRLITDPDVFDKYGLDRSRMIEAADTEVALHQDGEVLK